MAAEQSNAGSIARAVEILRRGGLVAFPTETVYGLGARALDPEALAKIFVAKGRPTHHPLIAHVLGEADARSLASSWPSVATRLAAAFWPGPLTLVVARAAHVPLALTGGGDSVAVRAPSHPVARALLEALGEPIAAPSANRYQTLSPTTAAHVAASLGDRVELILDGGPCEAGIESTVVDVRGEMPRILPRILRRGALDFPTLAQVVPSLVDGGDAVVTTSQEVHVSPGLDPRHYAPTTPLILAKSRHAALEAARERTVAGQRVALLLVAPSEAPAGAHVIALGTDPVAYAHDLFATLHELDAGRFDAIVVEPVPGAPAWSALEDRLRRAGSY